MNRISPLTSHRRRTILHFFYKCFEDLLLQQHQQQQQQQDKMARGKKSKLSTERVTHADDEELLRRTLEEAHIRWRSGHRTIGVSVYLHVCVSGVTG
jgi:non-ribosomal peptide synthetase component E (peptide arylation enzyme)